MEPELIKKRVLSYPWEPWLSRPFFGFIMSTFCGGNTRQAFKKIGLPGWRCDFLLSNGEWYKADECYEAAKLTILKWLKTHSVKEISKRLEKSHLIWAEEVKQWAKEPQKNSTQKLKRLDAILREITTYVWAVHAAEHFFTPQLKLKVEKIIKNNPEKFIGDASFPSKLNAAEQMLEDYKKDVPAKLLAKKYGWMRARDGFTRPYTAKEIIGIAKHSAHQQKHKHPTVPKALEKIIAEARELVYLRMLRMDIYYELMYLAKPVLKATAQKYKIPFQNLKYYTLESLIKGKPKNYPADFTCASIGEKYYYFNESLIDNKISTTATEIKGVIAQQGLVRGTAKVVMTVKDLGKVNKGDILVTYMTSPNFLPAMKLAAGFVTNEGGLTCHAAIVAREMRKPCVIGTKVATKTFKDGDMVEVDANKGIVRKI